MPSKSNQSVFDKSSQQSSTPSSTSVVLDCRCVSRFGGFPSSWFSMVDGSLLQLTGRLCEEHFYAYKAKPSSANVNANKQSPIYKALLAFLKNNPGTYTYQTLAENLPYAKDSIRKQLYHLARSGHVIKITDQSGDEIKWQTTSLALSSKTNSVQSNKRSQTWFSCLPQ